MGRLAGWPTGWVTKWLAKILRSVPFVFSCEFMHLTLSVCDHILSVAGGRGALASSAQQNGHSRSGLARASKDFRTLMFLNVDLEGRG